MKSAAVEAYGTQYTEQKDSGQSYCNMGKRISDIGSSISGSDAAYLTGGL